MTNSVCWSADAVLRDQPIRASWLVWIDLTRYVGLQKVIGLTNQPKDVGWSRMTSGSCTTSTCLDRPDQVGRSTPSPAPPTTHPTPVPPALPTHTPVPPAHTHTTTVCNNHQATTNRQHQHRHQYHHQHQHQRFSDGSPSGSGWQWSPCGLQSTGYLQGATAYSELAPVQLLLLWLLSEISFSQLYTCSLEASVPAEQRPAVKDAVATSRQSA